MARIIQAFKHWLPFAAITVMVSMLVYGTVQQNFRQNANDPQIQLAEDISRTLSEGGAPGSGISLPQIDFGKSLSPFVIIYDSKLKPLAYTGTLNGNTPAPPNGSFEAARNFGENRITWEPENNVRIATVIRPYKNDSIEGYVLAGRSLREVEIRENRLSLQVLLFMITALVVTFAISFAKISEWI